MGFVILEDKILALEKPPFVLLFFGNAGNAFFVELLEPWEVHPENFRCLVAALRRPGWFRHYQGIKRLASAGSASAAKKNMSLWYWTGS